MAKDMMERHNDITVRDLMLSAFALGAFMALQGSITSADLRSRDRVADIAYPLLTQAPPIHDEQLDMVVSRHW